jgi:hypothetical protein
MDEKQRVGGVIQGATYFHPFGSSRIELVEMRRREWFSTRRFSTSLEPARTERADLTGSFQ